MNRCAGASLQQEFGEVEERNGTSGRSRFDRAGEGIRGSGVLGLRVNQSAIRYGNLTPLRSGNGEGGGHFKAESLSDPAVNQSKGIPNRHSMQLQGLGGRPTMCLALSLHVDVCKWRLWW